MWFVRLVCDGSDLILQPEKVMVYQTIVTGFFEDKGEIPPIKNRDALCDVTTFVLPGGAKQRHMVRQHLELHPLQKVIMRRDLDPATQAIIDTPYRYRIRRTATNFLQLSISVSIHPNLVHTPPHHYNSRCTITHT